MLPCLSHITYMNSVNKIKISKKYEKNNKNIHHQHHNHNHSYVYDDINLNLNIHTIAQLDFILFQQVF
jgi:hypothetical protein